MVFLGLEKPVEYGSRLIFDPTMAKMVLDARDSYINALKDDYLRGREDLKEFNKNFGDFFSPILKDMEWYDLNVTGATRDLINNLYAQGIDPLRSVEGRSLISRWVNNMPVGEINKRKQSAATATEYLKRRAELESEGRFNPDVEDFYGRNMDKWDTGVNGIWGYSSPMKNITMDEIVEPIISHLDYRFDNDRTNAANDGYDYYTVTEDRIRQTIADAMEDLTRDGTMPGYYYQRALQLTGGDKDAARALYTDWLTNRGKDHLKEKREANPFALKELEYQNDRKLAILRASLSNPRPDSGEKSLQIAYDYANDMYDSGLNNIAGFAPGFAYKDVDGNSIPAEKYYDRTNTLTLIQWDFGKDVINRFGKDDLESRINAYENRFIHQRGLSGNTFASFLDKKLFEGTTNNSHDWKGKGVVRITNDDLNRIRTIEDMVTNTSGYRGVHKTGDKDTLKLIANIKANPNDYLLGGNNISVYGAFNKQKGFQNDFLVDVYSTKTGLKVGTIAYDSYNNSEDTEGGLYLKGDDDKLRKVAPKAITSRNLRNRHAVTQGSTNVNKNLGLSRDEKQNYLSPYIMKVD